MIRATDDGFSSTRRRPRCFVLENTGVDVSPAEFFGEIIPLYNDPQAGMLPDHFDPYFGPTLHALCEEYDFDPGRDFVVMSGRMHSVVVSITWLMHYYKRLQLLVYSPKSKRYSRRLLTFTEDTSEDVNSDGVAALPIGENRDEE
jgi:hypothetical protein